MDLNSSRRLAATALADIASSSTPLALVGDVDVVDIGWAFIFDWNTRRWFETRNSDDAAGPGAGPIVVVKTPASAFALDSTPSIDEQLAQYAIAQGLPVPPLLGW